MTPLVGAAIGVMTRLTPMSLLTLWMLLLNRRDRRRDALEAIVGRCCAELGLHGALAVDVRVALCRRRIGVGLDMRLRTTDEMWQAIAHLHPRLPRWATLRVVRTGSPGGESWPPLQRAVVVVLSERRRRQAGGIAPVRSTMSR